MLRTLDLFSGIGGFALAAQMVNRDYGKEIFRTDQFVEAEPFCQKVLKKNFRGIAVHDDIRTYSDKPRSFDLITAGFPCQDISSAGQGEGIGGERSGLFLEVIRLIRKIRPSYVLLENVAALLTGRGGRDMGTVLWELSQCGYDAEWSIVSACSVGASHMRKRVFIVAYPNSVNAQGLALQQENKQSIQQRDHFKVPGSGVRPKPRTTGMVNGVPGGVDRRKRIKALGNSVVPAVAKVPLSFIAQATLNSC